MMQKLVTVEGISKSFQSIRAVDNLSFEIQRGEIFALLGPNGAGKTTATRMLLGIIRPDSGSIRFSMDGHSIAEPLARQTGYLPEDRGLYRDMPVQKTLVYMGVLRGMGREEAAAAAGVWLEKVGLADRAKDKLETLSKGNQQKVQFISSILHAPLFAVLDEPFSGLDPVNQDFFVDIIRALRDGGATVLLSAHQMNLVERLADRVLLINRGKEVLQGTIASIKEQARSTQTVVVTVDGEVDPDLFRTFPAVVDAGKASGSRIVLHLKKGERINDLLAAASAVVTITAVHSDPISLHEVFVDAIAADGDQRSGENQQ